MVLGGEAAVGGAKIFQNFCDSTFLVLGSDLYFVDVSSLFSFAICTVSWPDWWQALIGN